MSDGIPVVRRKWYVVRSDLGREVIIVQTLEDDRGRYRFMVPTEAIPEHTPERFYSGHYMMQGNEPSQCHYDAEEAQQLMDALWQAGLRPTRQ